MATRFSRRQSRRPPAPFTTAPSSLCRACACDRHFSFRHPVAPWWCRGRALCGRSCHGVAIGQPTFHHAGVRISVALTPSLSCPIIGDGPFDAATLRVTVSLAAILITTALLLRIQATTQALAAQAVFSIYRTT